MSFLGNVLGFGRKLGGSLAGSVGQTLGQPLRMLNSGLKFGDSIIGKDEMNAIPFVSQARLASGKGNLAVKIGDGLGNLIDPKKTGKGYNVMDPLSFAHGITGQPRPFLLR